AGAAAGHGGERPPAAPTLEEFGRRFTAWTFGPLPQLLELRAPGGRNAATLIGYPALVDRGDAVELQVLDDAEAAAAANRTGIRRLFALALREPLRQFERSIPDSQRLSLLYMPFGTAEQLRRELVDAVLQRACLAAPLPADAEAFGERVAQARPRLTLIGQEIARTLMAILTEHSAVQRKLPAARGFPAAAADIEQQLAGLLPPRFVSETDPVHFGHLPRYLKAISLRLDKLRTEPTRDAQKMAELAPLVQNLRRRTAALKGRHDPQLAEFRWLLEELRVSLFAQELRTPVPVSTRRLQKVWESIRQ
ncbi:MAG TPA: DUF3418 domain-containing protein, partial [Burkholderiaceae bacterium]|nr:DUF3418 domain-containing protein [Burkholderiaceae bacterium]